MKIKAASGIMLMLLAILPGLTGNFTPQVKATFTASNWVEEITTPDSTAVEWVDVDSQGILYVADQESGKLWKSLNRGVTWTEIGDPTWTFIYGIYVDSRDYVYAQPSATKIYRSTNQGSDWTLVLNSTNRLWHWDEDSSGRLYANDYDNSAPTTAVVYRSNTDGSAWEVWYNLTGQVWHFHTVDVAPNDYVFVSTGDTHRGADYGSIRRWNGTTWEIIVQQDRLNEADEQRYTQPTTIWFMDNDAYFGCDEWRHIIKMPITGSWSEHETVLDVLSIGIARSIFDSVNIDGIVFLEDASGGCVFATWDGKHYVKLFDSSDGIEDFSHRQSFPFYFTTQTNGALYRIDYMTREDLVNIFYHLCNSARGLVINEDTYILEQRVSNGTNYADLTNVALTDVQASIKGLTHEKNYLSNGGFESGDTTNWTIAVGGSSYISVVSDEQYQGTYSAKINITGAGSASIEQVVTVYPHEFLLLTFALKVDEAKANMMYLCVMNDTGGETLWQDLWAGTTIWVSRTLAVPLVYNVTWQARLKFYFPFAVTGARWVDAFMAKKPEASFLLKSDTEDSGAFEQFLNDTYTDSGTTETLNPTLTINGQEVSHSGELSNGTESSATSLSSILTGAVQVQANIQGSGQAILKLNGTRLLYEDSIILEGRTSTAYHGRYYGTFSPTTNTTDLIAVTNLASKITSLSYASNKLTLTIDSPTGTTSTSKVYCGNKGKPIEVTGATSWSYNASTMILTLNVMHDGPANLLVDWRIPGDVNGDGKVNNSDLSDLSKAYGSHPSKPNWNPDCDLNWDSKVDASDLFDLSKNYI